MAFVTLFILVMWMYQVRVLLALFIGLHAPTTFDGFIEVVVGHAGRPDVPRHRPCRRRLQLALVLFSLTVVSFPLLLDREVDFVTAMITSVKAPSS